MGAVGCKERELEMNEGNQEVNKTVNTILGAQIKLIIYLQKRHLLCIVK